MLSLLKGPKEGRSPPGLLYAGPHHSSRGRIPSRHTAVGLTVLLCFLLGYVVISSGDTGITLNSSTRTVLKPGFRSPGHPLLADNKAPSLPNARAHEPQPDITLPTGKPDLRPSKQPPSEIPLKPVIVAPPERTSSMREEDEVDYAADIRPISPKAQNQQNNGQSYLHRPSDKTIEVAAPAREKWADRPDLEKALSHVITMLPDEFQMRELIRPVDGSGKEKMREMGLRTRAYRRYFEAWEALHLTSDSEGATYIRDDIIQYIRSRQHLESDSQPSEGGINGLDVASTIRQYEAYRIFIQKFAELLFPWTMPWFGDHMTLRASLKKGGRGIVLTAGDDQAPYLLTTIYSFRQLGCTLPIEVMYLGDSDLGEDYRTELEALPGVVTRDISQMTRDSGWRLAGWAAKPFAILLSSFREVIFIDADSLFFKNPEILFEEPDYQRTGALFFKDRLIMPESRKRWLQQILPKPIPKAAKESRFWTGESGHMQESGVVVVDKWKHFVAMLLITRFNGPDRDGNKEHGVTGVYDMVYGDKETFWIGFLLAGDEGFAFHKGDAGTMGELGQMETTSMSSPSEPSSDVAVEEHDISNYTLCSPQLLHLDTTGKPLWFNGWLLKNKFADKRVKTFANFESYLIEPRELREPGAWQLAESNMCCLTTDVDKKFDFTAQEMAILNMIMARAHEMGMGNQH